MIKHVKYFLNQQYAKIRRYFVVIVGTSLREPDAASTASNFYACALDISKTFGLVTAACLNMEVGIVYCFSIHAIQSHCAVNGATRLTTTTRRRAQVGVPETDSQTNRYEITQHGGPNLLILAWFGH